MDRALASLKYYFLATKHPTICTAEIMSKIPLGNLKRRPYCFAKNFAILKVSKGNVVEQGAQSSNGTMKMHKAMKL